ncbi:uncharacterized protein LOC110443887 [Mizuhopecten yessoensis]|uniref:RBR-type E3 ubiquitin transferase n=1 Tax=Mizuhopecten yessoensis TaxID=6573 RepID=A0A210PE43_MIZYE|nr:uncharacterized protein LOC110443887 [Mizuhopecten yessoensis]XP_021344009.1 uncharacterized protein LOC110443887 [Mizuhopecten yessoensis]OWF34721.1 E3 ubiquitin-protein ligase ARI1 [Mizuhopecten yessoensis]
MVYKSDKYHVRSGNTLRTCNTRGSHLYRRQSFLVLQSTDDLNPAVLDDLGLDRNNVAYSLNKKGRWLVPQILKHELSNSDENIKVNLVESHKLKRKIKYTGFHSNDGFPRKVSPKRTYFDLNSLKCKTSAPTVTVNIVTPCPTTSSLARNPKYLDYTPTHKGNDDTSETSHKESNPMKIRTSTQRMKMFMDTEMDECQEESEYSEHADDDIYPDEEAYKPRPTTVCVGDILTHSKDMQELLFRKLDTSQSTDVLRKPYNQHPLTEEREMENGATGGHSTTRPSFTTSMPRHITIFIPNTEVQTGHLQEVFGEDYIECRCFPRKFVIDITEKVTSTILKFKAFQNRDMKRVDFSAVLVFAYDMFGSLDSTDMDSFKVSINMKTTHSCLKLETLPEKGVFGIEQIIQGAISYIATIPCDNFVSKDIPSFKTIPAKTNHNILKLCNTEVTSVFPENITIRDILKENRKKHDTSMGNVEFESLPPDTCSICFESILNSPATALQSCGHWFCDSCWNDHVITTAGCSTRRITCPEYKCQSTVDYDILLTTSKMQIVTKMFQRLIDKETDKESSSKWCPNKKCGRVIRSENKEIGQIMNVTCECGTAFCFDCLQPVHWPLSCRDHDKYLEKLKKHGYIDKSTKTEEVFTFTVRGKRCPVCNAFVVKEGGCFSMICVCGTNFCWGCLKTIDDHPSTPCYHGNMYSTYGDNFRTRTKKIVQHINAGHNNDQPDWYKRAVMIRSWRNLSNVKIMSSAVRGMCRTLTSYKRRQDAGIGAELGNFELPESLKHTCVTDKIHPFLTSMIGVYLEASLICEYTTVFLEICQDQNIIQIRDCLQCLTKEIHTIFRVSNNVDLKSSVTRLFHLRNECEKVINKLVDTME